MIEIKAVRDAKPEEITLAENKELVDSIQKVVEIMIRENLEKTILKFDEGQQFYCWWDFSGTMER